MDDGFGTTRRQIAWNDFITVGPSNDPAHILGGKDSVVALKAIASARAPFVSRGDRSGANAAELRLWRIAGRTPEALNPEKWYRGIGGGMGQALNATSAMNAYTLFDRGTWLSFGNKGPLVIMIEGDPRLVNRYDVIELNPPKHGPTRLDTAKIFADWLVSSEGQRAIAAHQMNGQQLFNPSAASPKQNPLDLQIFALSAEQPDRLLRSPDLASVRHGACLRRDAGPLILAHTAI